MTTRYNNNNNNIATAQAQFIGTEPTIQYGRTSANNTNNNEPEIVYSPTTTNNSTSTNIPFVSATPIKNDDSNKPSNNNYSSSPTYAATPISATSTTSPQHQTQFVIPATTYTGEEVLRIMKQRRKKATVSSGFFGGTLGLVFLGPIGAVGIGAASAVITKQGLKRKERKLRRQFEAEGKLNEPVAAGIGFGGAY